MFHLKGLRAGVIYMVLSALFYALNGAIVKSLTPQIPVTQCMVFRYVVALFFIVPIMLRRNISFWGTDRKLLFFRSFFGFAASLLQYYVFAHLNLAYAMSLLYTSPVFIGLMSFRYLKESVSSSLLVYIFVSFLGCLMIIQPSWDSQLFYSLLCLISALLTACAQMFIRKLHATDSFMTIVFNFLFWSAVISIGISLPNLVWPNGMQLLALLTLGLFGGIAQMFMTYAFKFGQSNVLSPYSYFVVLFSGILEWILWGEVMNVLATAGVVVLISCSIGIARWNYRLKSI